MPKLRYTDANGVVIFLAGNNGSGSLQLRRLLGAGMPGLLHQVVRTPNRDGEVYVGRTVLEPRFLIADMRIAHVCTWEQEHDLRQRLTTRLSPKTGVGTLRYWPDSINVYEIDTLVERGVEFQAGDLPDGMLRRLAISFRCSDPAWRIPTLNSQDIAVAVGGLSVPITVPLSFVNNAETATITNVGSLESFPIIRIPGSITVPRVTNDTTGEYIEFNTTVAAGRTLIIDMDLRTAELDDGTNMMPFRTSGSVFWGLEPGANSITCSSSSQAGNITFTFTWYTLLLGV